MMPRKFNVLRYIHQMDKCIFPVIILKCFAQAIQNLTIVMLSTHILNQLADGVKKDKILLIAVAGVFLILVLKVLEAGLKKYLVVHINASNRNYSFKLGDKSLEVDYPQLENCKVDELKQRIREDNSWGAGVLGIYQSFEGLMQNIATVLVNGIILFPFITSKEIYKVSYLYIYFILFGGMTILAAVINSRFVKKYIYKVMDQMSHNVRLFFFFLFDKSVDYKSGMDVRIYQAQNLIDAHVRGDELNHLKTQYSKLSHAAGAGGVVEEVVSALLIGGAYLIVILTMGNNPKFVIGNIILCASCLSNLLMAMNKFIGDRSVFKQELERQNSSMEFFDIEEVLVKGNRKLEISPNDDYMIEFKDVSFAYPYTEEFVLKDISVKIKKGDCIAIVGLNGSGKTTFIKLLCRLYDVTKGEILLNGTNIKEYRYEDYMNFMSVVFQDFRLFSFGLGENVAGSQRYDVAKVEECLRDVELEERYKKLDRGVETVLYGNYDKNGVEISGGEAQKIAIARALYKDANMLILDEPTAALDPITECEIYSQLNSIIRGRTTIFISHRLYSCKFCKRVLVFEKGEIVQTGTHKELLAEAGLYQEMWNTQVQYYI